MIEEREEHGGAAEAGEPSDRPSHRRAVRRERGP